MTDRSELPFASAAQSWIRDYGAIQFTVQTRTEHTARPHTHVDRFAAFQAFSALNTN
jgi:hypothetical protein